MSGAGAPFFVVGCARSGTTLLRVMLDAHPDLAVPPESHFVVGLAPRRASDPVSLDRILAHPRVATWGLDPERVRAVAESKGATTYAELTSAVFTAYAEAHGKGRWGDKTPGYVEHLPTLARLFPDAHFVHVIRDGREVAASLAEWPWGPASPVAGGFWWRRKVGRGRRDGAAVGARYRELRLEDLVADPEGELRALCAFLDLPFDEAMLDYPRHAEERMARPGETWLAVTHPHLAEPPTAGLRDWRAGLSTTTQAAVVAACGPLLRELGYDAAPSRPLAIAQAWLQRAVDAARTARRDLTSRLRRGSSDV